MPQDWTKLLYSTAINFQYRVSPASEARVLPESICVSQNTHVGLISERVVDVLYSRSSLKVTNACIGEGYRL